MGETAGKLSEKATRNPPGRTPGTTWKTPENLRNCRRENPFSRHAPPLRWQGLRPHFHMPAHLPFHFHPSASHHTPPKHPRHPARGAWMRQPSANGTGRRHCRPHARRMGVRLHGAKAPRPPKRRKRQAPARGPAAVNSRHRPIRNKPQHPSPLLMGLGCVNPAPTALAGGTAATLLVGWGFVCMEPRRPVPQNAAGGKPLLVGLPPSTPATAPFGTKRSTQAPCSWGLGA